MRLSQFHDVMNWHRAMQRTRAQQMGLLPEAAGIVAAEAAAQREYLRPILIGVATGVSVWTITRMLERMFRTRKR